MCHFYPVCCGDRITAALPIGRETVALDIDWVKDTAILVSVATGIEKMMKLYRLWKAANHGQTAAMGLTVKNGEYQALVKTLGRIEKRVDETKREMRGGQAVLSQRIESIEQRLST